MPNRSNNTDNDNYKFTRHERDKEAGLNLDYMNARSYDPTMGHSPDKIATRQNSI